MSNEGSTSFSADSMFILSTSITLFLVFCVIQNLIEAQDVSSFKIFSISFIWAAHSQSIERLLFFHGQVHLRCQPLVGLSYFRRSLSLSKRIERVNFTFVFGVHGPIEGVIVVNAERKNQALVLLGLCEFVEAFLFWKKIFMWFFDLKKSCINRTWFFLPDSLLEPKIKYKVNTFLISIYIPLTRDTRN